MFQRADLVVADLTITYDREQAVDFTMPFMNLGRYLVRVQTTLVSSLGQCDGLFSTHLRTRFRHQYSVPETDQTAAELVFVSVPSVAGRVDLHGHGVPRRVRSPLHIGQVTRVTLQYYNILYPFQSKSVYYVCICINILHTYNVCEQ